MIADAAREGARSATCDYHHPPALKAFFHDHQPFLAA
jgi:hypothetical protein